MQNLSQPENPQTSLEIKEALNEDSSAVNDANTEIKTDFDGSNTEFEKAIENFQETVKEMKNSTTSKQNYIQELISYIENNKGATVANYDVDKIENDIFNENIDDNFHNKVLVFNLIYFIRNTSITLKRVYGEGKIEDDQKILDIAQKLQIFTNFSQDVITNLDQPMTVEQVKEYHHALSQEIHDYNNYKQEVLSSLQNYQQLPKQIDGVAKVLGDIGNKLGNNQEKIQNIHNNIGEIKKAVDEQLKIVSKQAEFLSTTMENINSCIKDVKQIEIAKIERLRTFSPDLQDAESRAQYYVLNALVETQAEISKNVSRDINGLRLIALNFVKMTAVMNFIVKYGLVGKTSINLYQKGKLLQYTEISNLILKEDIFTSEKKSIVDDFPGLFQYCYLGALNSNSNKKILIEDTGFEFNTLFKDSNYIDFMLSYYYIQIIFPFLSDQMNVGRYIILLNLMEKIFIDWITNIQNMLSKKDQFKMMKEAYLKAINMSMRDINKDYLELQQNLTIFQSASSGLKRGVSWIGELFIKNSSFSKLGKTFKNYNVKANHVEDFYQLFTKNYKEQLGNNTTVNLPMVLLLATDLSINSIKNKEVDMIKVMFTGALTGGVASLIGLSKFKSVMAGLTASTVYGMSNWVCNSFTNGYHYDKQRVDNNTAALNQLNTKTNQHI